MEALSLHCIELRDGLRLERRQAATTTIMEHGDTMEVVGAVALHQYLRRELEEGTNGGIVTLGNGTTESIDVTITIQTHRSAQWEPVSDR